MLDDQGIMAQPVEIEIQPQKPVFSDDVASAIVCFSSFPEINSNVVHFKHQPPNYNDYEKHPIVAPWVSRVTRGFSNETWEKAKKEITKFLGSEPVAKDGYLELPREVFDEARKCLMTHAKAVSSGSATSNTR